MNILKILTSKPYLNYTDKERKQLFEILEQIIAQGSQIVLGNKRCFMCGEELGEASGEKKKLGNYWERQGIIVNLCNKCYRISG